MASIATSRYSWLWSPGRLLVVVLWFCTLSASLSGPTGRQQPTTLSKAESWLIDHGYLDPSSSDPFSLSEAIRNMQKFYNLQVTGQMNQQTQSVMAQPRCADPDKNIHLAVGGKWDHFDLTYRVENFAPNLAWQDTLKAIRKAFQVWENASPFTFEEIDSNADITVSFHKCDFGPDLCQISDVGHMSGHDVHFDSERQWIGMDQNVQGSFNVFLVAVHFLGHSLGLKHSSDPRSIMHPSYKWTETEDFQLPEDVRQEIQQLYSNCPSGWQMFGDSCYYMYITGGTWQQARDFCLSEGADLVVINNGEEQEFIRGLTVDAWIGLTWTGRRWTWVDGTRLTTQYWGVGEPDDDESRNCAVHRQATWENYKCSSSFHAICEKSVR